VREFAKVFRIKMEEIIRRLSGKKIDVSCGSGPVLRGEVVDVREGVLYLRDEDDKTAYIAVDKIATVCECSDNASRPGFIG
jgi:hypothetical protein